MKKILAALTLIGVVALCCHVLGHEWEDCMRNSTQPSPCAGNNDPDETNYTIPIPETGTR